MRSQIVCNCNGVSKADIEAVVKDGHYLLHEVIRRTGAAGSCGRCRLLVDEIIANYLVKQQAFQTTINWSGID
jgi:NAD(P)H-nitrite reductase large subunit